ncbi:MAG: fused MFS/spermidine synthase [Bradyrhizobiaceae bacterium]|nr:fused MFS/spermidine synthase [Bradyrhizobiaceae bacterium]
MLVRPGLLLAVYGVAIFLSASLLFSVQPLFAKLVLPSLGGAPAVWSVALVFFQAALLAGYLYAHLITVYLPGRQSVIVHLLVMLAATVALPLGIASGWGRPPSQWTELWLLGLFAASIGLPFFALSANAPLLQAWFARTGHPSAHDPYFLYAASNVGSFAALLSYPFLVEPLTALSQQTRFWSGLFVALIVLIALCGLLLVQTRNALPAVPRDGGKAEQTPGWKDALIWIALGAVPAAYLVAVTAHISTDVAAVPLLWVLPLALYLLTFVIVFQTKPIIPHDVFLKIQPYAVALLLAALIFKDLNNIFAVIAINLGAFFVTAMVCHGELVRRRPAARHLTSFYLWLATGGVIGGIFSGLIAPNIFNWVAEYPLLIVAGLLCRPGLTIPREWRAWLSMLGALALVAFAVLCIRVLGIWPDALSFRGMVGVVLLVVALFLAHDTLRLAGAFACVLVLIYAYIAETGTVTTVRSFFGVHKIYESISGGAGVRVLMHGTTIHGAQRIEHVVAQRRGRPATITYFGPQSPMAAAFDGVKKNKGRPIRVAVVGLGTGTVACFLDQEDALDFYEIDRTVVQIALDPAKFEFVSSCKPDSRVILGDARLMLEDAPDAHYDLIVMDAFSSDAVPVHLLTREAMALYLRKLAPGGMIVSHVMNRHMELASVVAGIAAANGAATRVMHSSYFESEQYIFGSSVAAVARTDEDFGVLRNSGDWAMQEPAGRVWSDDYSNIAGAMIRRLQDE